VREWYKRDHAAEQREWLSWLHHIEGRVKGLRSVTTEYLQPEDLSNRAPRLRINWDANQLKITGTELVARLDKGTPRILVDGGTGRRPDKMDSSLTIMPYMMAAGEEKIVADAIYDGLTHPGHYENPVIPQGAPVQIAGNWAVEIKYIRGIGEQKFTLQQEGDSVTGTQQGEIYKADLKGRVQADHIELTSDMAVPGNSIFWTFRGVVSGDNASGNVHMGEYGDATWTAVRS